MVAVLAPPPVDLIHPASGAPTVLPDLAAADRIRLAWLPGIGRGRAAQLILERAHLGVPLTPSLLDLVPGFGPGTASEVQDWVRRRGLRRAGGAP